MTDRELLELAAKAAGYGVRWHDNWQCFVHIGPYNITNPPTMSGQRMVWVPLDDDGDALRLAVELGIDIEWRADGRVAAYRHANADGHCFTALESSREDRQENTRRAIVRAAAEVGRRMIEENKP